MRPLVLTRDVVAPSYGAPYVDASNDLGIAVVPLLNMPHAAIALLATEATALARHLRANRK